MPRGTVLFLRQVRQDQVVHVGRLEDVGGEQVRLAGDAERAGVEAGEDAVRAAHERRVERDDVHQVAEAEFFLQERHADFRFEEPDGGVGEQLDGVVARLAVDVDGAGIIGGAVVVPPVVVGEPGVGLCHSHEVACARVVQVVRTLAFGIQHLGYAGRARDERPHLVEDRGVVHVDVRHLVVRYGEGGRGAGVEHLAPQLLAVVDPAALAEQPVQVDGPRDGPDAVLGQHHDAHAARLVEADEVAADGVDLAHVGGDAGVGGAVFLQPVVQVRQVDEAERGRVVLLDVLRRVGDPAAGADGGVRPPELEQRERPETLLEHPPQIERPRVHVRQLAPVRRVHRPRRDGHVDGRVHVVPPEQVGARERRVDRARRLPYLRTLDEVVRLPPELHLALVAEVPPVPYDPVLGRPRARQVRRLHGARDGGQHGPDGHAPPTRGERVQVRRRVPHQVRRQPDDVKDDDTMHDHLY